MTVNCLGAKPTYDDALFRRHVKELCAQPQLSSIDIISLAFWRAASDLASAARAAGKFEEADAEFRRTMAPNFATQLATEGFDIDPDLLT